MAQRFGPPAVLSPAANTGRIGKGRKSDGGTKSKPGRVETVRNPGQHDFKTAEEAKAFASWDKLKDTMKNAGVKGPPQIWFATKADK